MSILLPLAGLEASLLLPATPSLTRRCYGHLSSAGLVHMAILNVSGLPLKHTHSVGAYISPWAAGLGTMPQTSLNPRYPP